MNKTVQCSEHGSQPETFVCQHIVRGLFEGVPYGFFWARDVDTPRPDAWCSACNEMVSRSGGEWTDEAVALASVKILCGRCYDRAKMMNNL